MVDITEHNAREAAAAAERLLRDPFLAEAFDEMVSAATQTAITGRVADERETARQKVLAIMELRANLQSVCENWRAAAATLQRGRAHE
jgi:hypothetical protein